MRPRRTAHSIAGCACGRYMPASGAWSHISRPQTSSVVKWPLTTMTPRPPARAASRCSRPSTTSPRRSGSTEPHQARANSNRPMPIAPKWRRSSASRAAASSPGKHSSRLRAATRRRSGSAARSRTPIMRPSARCSGHGRRAASAIAPIPSQVGQCRGPRGGLSRWLVMRGFYGPGAARARLHGGFAILARMEAAPRDRAAERLLRGLYSAAPYLLVPVTVYHLLWRGFRQAEYLERWGERYAAYRTPALHDGCIWVHAVSVGEVNAAAPLVNALLELRPDLRLLVTTITPTGSARVRALWGDRVE